MSKTFFLKRECGCGIRFHNKCIGRWYPDDLELRQNGNTKMDRCVWVRSPLQSVHVYPVGMKSVAVPFGKKGHLNFYIFDMINLAL